MKTSASQADNRIEVGPDVLAFALGISSRQVQNLAEKGIAKRTESGAYDLVASVRGYIEAIKTDRKAKSGTYEAAKLKEKEAKARLAQLEADEREGKLLELSLVQQTCGNICTAFANRLSNFGDGIAGILHQQNSDFIAQRINEGLRSALRELSKMPYVPNEKDTK